MAHRSQSPPPQFGNWDSEANVSYTEYFEKANKNNNNGTKKSPNDRRENRSPLNGPSQNRPKHQRHMSHEDNQITNGSQFPRDNDTKTSPVDSLQGSAVAPTNDAEAQGSNGQDSVKSRHEHQKDGQRVGTDSLLRYGGVSNESSPRRVLKQGADRSSDRSPLHQSKLGPKSGVSSPSSERRTSSEAGTRSFAPSTPARSRLASVNRGDESLDHGTAVPKFGDWDDSNPEPAVGYTQLFDQVHDEKLENEAGGVTGTGTPRSYLSGNRQHNKGTSKRCGCFPW
ncbi:hypothetical protein ACFE04_008701 [Oxalis oulophora]